VIAIAGKEGAMAFREATAHSRDIAKAKTILRVVPKTPEIEPMAPRATASNACEGSEI
jgi:hypothetical protein